MSVRVGIRVESVKGVRIRFRITASASAVSRQARSHQPDAGGKYQIQAAPYSRQKHGFCLAARNRTIVCANRIDSAAICASRIVRRLLAACKPFSWTGAVLTTVFQKMRKELTHFYGELGKLLVK